MLGYTVLGYTELGYTAHCTELGYTVLYCTILHIVTPCIILHTVLYCTLYYTALYHPPCIILHYTIHITILIFKIHTLLSSAIGFKDSGHGVRNIWSRQHMGYWIIEEETLVETRLVTDDGSIHTPSIHPSMHGPCMHRLLCFALHWEGVRGEGPGGSKGRSDTIRCYAIPWGAMLCYATEYKTKKGKEIKRNKIKRNKRLNYKTRQDNSTMLYYTMVCYTILYSTRRWKEIK